MFIAPSAFECSACHRIGQESEFFRCDDGVLICPPCEEPAEPYVPLSQS